MIKKYVCHPELDSGSFCIAKVFLNFKGILNQVQNDV